MIGYNMARRLPDEAQQPLELDIRRFDEANVARLGLISIQERIPPDFTSWTIELEREGRVARLTCDALEKHGGVPHGLDNDVSLALITLFQDSGSPSSGEFVTTAYQILKLMGLHTGGSYYQAVKESLERLTTVTYTASEAWRSGGRWTTVKFRYIDRLEFSSPDERLSLGGDSILKITLAKEIVNSINAKYLKPLDLDFLTSLERPLTRALYRLLDAQRFPVDIDQGPVSVYEVGLLKWAEACKIVDRKPARVRRTLEGAHDELLIRRYLSDVHYEGRGSEQTIRYTFANRQQNPALDPEGLQLLVQNGVVSTVARSLVRQYPLERIKERVAKYKAMLQAGYAPRNQPGLLVDVLKDDTSKYTDPEGFVSESQKLKGQKAKQQIVQATRQQELFADEQVDTQWTQLERPQRIQRALRTLTLLFGNRLPIKVLDNLHQAMIGEQLEPRKVQEMALRANLDGKLTELADLWMDEFGET